MDGGVDVEVADAVGVGVMEVEDDVGEPTSAVSAGKDWPGLNIKVAFLAYSNWTSKVSVLFYDKVSE